MDSDILSATGFDLPAVNLAQAGQRLEGKRFKFVQTGLYRVISASFALDEYDMAEIDIYTKPYCPYCDRAKALLEKKGVAFKEIVASNDPVLRAEMNERSGRYTYPQIFIDSLHIGGCDDLFALDSRGGLDPLLAN